MEAWEIHEEEEDYGNNNADDYQRKEKKRRDRIRSLVQEFSIVPSANCCSEKVGDITVVERWLTELGVEWVLIFASARVEIHVDALIWTRALDEFTRNIWTLFPNRSSMALQQNMWVRHVGEGQHLDETCILDQYQFVMFIQGTMLKMLTFVDVIVAWDPYVTVTEGFLFNPVKLIVLLGVHDALYEASNMIVLVFDPPTSVEVQRIENEMVILLSANKSKVGEAIRSTMEEIRTKLMGDGDDYSSSSLNPHSSDIHEVTQSIMMYIRFLWANYRSVDAALHGKYLPHIENLPPLDSMIRETVSCLEIKLADISESFPDQGLRFLFLLNNLYSIQQQVNDSPQAHKVLALDLTHKVEDHVERYVEQSWALLLSCLFNPTPLCFDKNYSLFKFESEFQKIYTTQKQWKVPDPSLRIRLHKAIMDKIIPGYTEYLEDNKSYQPKIQPPGAQSDAARTI